MARARGFWRGVLTGLVLAAAAALALAWAFPPLRPPELAPGALTVPAAPEAPGPAAEPELPTRSTPPDPAGSPSLVPTGNRR